MKIIKIFILSFSTILFLAVLPSHIAVAQEATCNNGTCSFPYFGTSSGQTTKMWANSLTGQNNWLTLSVGGSGTVHFYGSTGSQIGTRSVSNGGSIEFPSGTKGFSLSSSGSEIYAIRATSDNSASRIVNFKTPSGGNDGGSDGGNDGGDNGSGGGGLC
ncbi:hypothetical protein CHH59_21510, partial [Shouchella clausii]